MTHSSFGLCIPGLLSEAWLFPVFRKHQVVGRSPDAGIRIGDRSVSRKHAEVWTSGAKVLFRDMRSRNGTYLGKTRVTEVELQAGDEIRVGRVFRLVVTDGCDNEHLESVADPAAESIRQFLDSRPNVVVDREQITSMYSVVRSLFDCTDAFQSLVATNEWMSDWLAARQAIIASPGEHRTTFTDRLSGHGTAGTDYDMEMVNECVQNNSMIFRSNVARYDQSADATIRRDVVAMPVKCSDGWKVVYGEMPHFPDADRLKIQLDLAFEVMCARIDEQSEDHQRGAEQFDPSRSLPAQPASRLTETQHQILRIIKKRGERMTKDQILTELEKENGAASDGATKQMLAEMVRHGILTNRQDTGPRGYGLPDWD